MRQEKIIWRRLSWMLTHKQRIFTSRARKQPSAERMWNHVAIQERDYAQLDVHVLLIVATTSTAGLGMGIDPDWTAFLQTLPDQHIPTKT